MVYEATHALIDIALKGSSRPYLTDEACAWIAQAVFAQKAGHGFPTHNPFVAKLAQIAGEVIEHNRNRKSAILRPEGANFLKAQMAGPYSAAKGRTIDTATMSSYGGP